MGDSFFQSNYEVLKKRNPAWAELLIKQQSGETPTLKMIGIESLEVTESKNGMPNLKVNRNGEEIYYHSRYNPDKEAKDIVDNCYNSKQNYFAILGMGMGYTADALLDRAEGKVYIVEPNPEAFFKAMEERDLKEILSSERVGISIGQTWSEAFQGWISSTKFFNLNGVGIVELPGAIKAAPDGYFDKFKEKLKAYVVTLGGNLQTVMLKGSEYQRNTLTSLPRIIDNPPVRMLFDKFAGKPAIIVSAGPSLSKNIELLATLKGKAVIIGVDTSLKPMLKAGIEPDFICTGDPQFANYKHLAGAKVKDAHLVAEPMTHPRSLLDYDGRLFIASYGDKMMQWLKRGIGDVGHVMCWGSVATMAFDFARKLGCDPIIFTGQDLSFSGGRTYVEGTYFEDELKRDMSVEGFAKREKVYNLTDIYGDPIKTNRQMFAYHNWFQFEISQTKAHVVNATEGGILKEGVEILTLQDTAQKYLSDEIDVLGTIERTKGEFEPYQLDTLRHNLEIALESFDRITAKCTTGLEKVQEIVNMLNGMTHYPSSICQEAIITWDKIRLDLGNEPSMKDFLEFTNQGGMLNFVRKYHELHGNKFTKHVMDEAMDLYAGLFHSTRRSVGQVRSFFAAALITVNERMEAHV